MVILCVGLDETLEGEEGDTGNSYASGDKRDLLLPESQRKLMEAIAETGKPVVLCLMAGSDIDLSYAAEHFDAVLQLWYPGSEGGKAAAQVLFGEVSPSGKLPVTFYESLEELPEFTDYRMEGRTYRYMKEGCTVWLWPDLWKCFSDRAETQRVRMAVLWYRLRLRIPVWRRTRCFRSMWKIRTAAEPENTRSFADFCESI
ncbi:MAG: glycoside hydrolase family 3 protein [Lachnospiraceae bacterium]